VVRFPDLPEIVTQGDDLAEALAQAADALEEALAGRIDDGLDIPAPYFPTAGQYLVACPAPTAAKAALYLALRESGLSKAALAARLGVDEKEPRRLLDPHHRTKLHRLTAALEVLGKRLVVGLAEAPARGAA
jgi:antitoxin HicB